MSGPGRDNSQSGTPSLGFSDIQTGLPNRNRSLGTRLKAEVELFQVGTTARLKECCYRKNDP